MEDCASEGSLMEQRRAGHSERDFREKHAERDRVKWLFSSSLPSGTIVMCFTISVKKLSLLSMTTGRDLFASDFNSYAFTIRFGIDL